MILALIRPCGCSGSQQYVLNCCKCHSARSCCDFERETHERENKKGMDRELRKIRKTGRKRHEKKKLQNR